MASETRNLFDVFEATAHACGDRIAVEVQRAGGLERVTYRELHALALDRSAWLRAAGIRPGDRCAILAHNDAHWCAAWLGTLAAGAVAVPLDTSYSASQVAAIAEDCGVRVLFVDARLEAVGCEAAANRGGGLAVQRLDDAPALHAEPSIERPDATAVALDAPAAILYTSGTTADPKGVVLTHGNLLAERDAAFAIVKVSGRDSVLGVLPLFHSLALLANLLLPLTAGARVVFLETIGSQELVRALSERGITVFACVPQFFNLIHERIVRDVAARGTLAGILFRAARGLAFRLRRVGIDLGPLLFARVHRMLGRRLRFFVTGGSRFDPVVGRDLYAMGLTVLQAYGLTETSGAATLSGPDEGHLDTVGRPLPGVEIRILTPPAAGPADAFDASEYGDGEVAIRGPIVTPGYYNRPDITAAAMQDGWFLTGDLGRVDSRGRLTITGRKKDVIILANGKNLYPEEIEAHYRQSAFVEEVCVTTVPAGGQSSGDQLFAVVVPDMERLRERKIVNAGEILRFELEGLGAGLPPHKRAHGCDIWFEPLPRTTTGKLKRREIERRLREKRRERQSRPSTSSAADPWLNDRHVAAAVARVRARVSGDRQLAADSNLELDLGLDSMGRVELVADLEQRFGVALPADQAAGIFTLGQLVEAFRPEGATPAAPSAAVPADRPAEAREDAAWNVLLGDASHPGEAAWRGLLERRPLIEPMLYVLGRVLRVVLARVEVAGLDRLPRRGPLLICPNHQSYLDPLFVCGVLPYRMLADTFFIGAVEYFETPLTAWLARKIHLLPVDPDSNLVPAMQASACGLAYGKVLVIFPEGERSIDGTVRKFKRGAAILSRHGRVPVVPVALKGVHEIWPRGGSFNWRVLLPWSRARVRLEFGEALRAGAGDTNGGFADRLRDAVDGMWQRL